MKSLILTVGIASLVVSFSAANAVILTLGGPLSQNCYEAALGRDARASSVDACTRSLAEESLTRSDQAATLVNRGILNMIRSHEADADADFNQALSIDNGLADAWLNKGFLKLRQDNGREALPLIQEGINRQPRRQALAFFARGLAYEQMGNFRAAYTDLRKAHDLEPAWSLPAEYLARYQVRGR